MLSDTCSELHGAVRKFLDYLFDDFGFVVASVKPALTDGRCLIVLSSQQCQFRIIFNRGDLEVAVGPLTAPASWEDSVAGVRQWYYLRSVLHYLDGDKYPVLDSLPKSVPFQDLEQKLAQTASDLRPDCRKVVQLFQADTFAAKQSEFDQFLQERNQYLRKQLDEWQKKQKRQSREKNT